MLESAGIDVPLHIYVSCDTYNSTGTGDGNNKDKNHNNTINTIIHSNIEDNNVN